MSDSTSIYRLLKELRKIVFPLNALFVEEDFSVDLENLVFPELPSVSVTQILRNNEELSSIRSKFSKAYETITNKLQDEDIDGIALLELFPAFVELFQTFQQLDELSFKETLSIEIDHLGKKVFDYLLIKYLKEEQPRYYALGCFIGIFEYGDLSIRWEFLVDFISNPTATLKKNYTLDSNRFNRELLVYNLHELLDSFLISNYVHIPDTAQLNLYDPSHEASEVYALKIPFLQWITEEDVYAEAGISILLPNPTFIKNSFPILSIGVYGTGSLEEKIHFDNNWSAGFKSSINSSDDLCLELHYEGIKPVLFSEGNLPDVYLDFSLEKRGESQNPTPVFHLLGSSLTLDNVGVKLGLNLIDQEKTEFIVALIIGSLKFSYDSSNADGFVQKILPIHGLDFSFDLVAGVSSLKGLFFQGTDGLEIVIPLHKKIGLLKLDKLELVISFIESHQLKAGIRTSFNAKLGPIAVSVSRIGLSAEIKFGEGGNLGILDLSGPSFLPPTGAGLAIKAGVINGGGYLDFDPDNERYAGILALKLGSFDLTAIGLITTRMPDGSKGFSLLVSIGVVFMPPIQLSYGFTLSGVGGLLGVNRRMVVEKIQDGLSEGSIDSIMFPVNAIENADRIISDLRAIFPPAEGQFVIAPFVKIGWGTPNIIQVDLGIFLEFPFKGRIILIGKLAAILPKPEKAILQLQVDVFGNFDFANERILILGALRDSYLYEYPLSGEFGFLLSWGQEKAFLLSAGGFHPRYQPPAGFPALKPIRLDISKGKFHIAASCYHAITANSFQFGARAELLADYDSVKMTGVLSFDTFIQFQPFGFTADMGLKVDVRFKGHKLAGADMNLALSGPSPWVASGTATFSIWIWDKDVDFYESWGGEPTGAIEAIKAWEDRLKPALESNDSWGFYLPPGTTQLALLKPLTEDKEQDTIYLPPNASLEIRQQALPLEADLEQLGNAPIAGSNRFAISGITIGGVEVDIKNTEPVEEYFARGQFFKLSDSDKLSTPAFDPMKAGIRIKSSTATTIGNTAEYEPGYENILIGDNLLAERDGIGTAADRSNTQTRRALHRKKWRNLPVGERMKQSLQAQVFGQNQVQKQAETSSVQADGERLATFETYTEAAQYVRAHSDGASSFKIVRK